MKIKRLLAPLALASTLIASGSASAITIQFSGEGSGLTGGYTQVAASCASSSSVLCGFFSWSFPGVSLTVGGFNLANGGFGAGIDTGLGGLSGLSGGGLGVVSFPHSLDPNNAANYEQVDAGDLLQLQFSTPVNITNIEFRDGSHSATMSGPNYLLNGMPLQFGSGGIPAGSIFNFGHAGTDYYIHRIDFAPVPEPSTWALLGVGLLGLGYMARRRTKQV